MRSVNKNKPSFTSQSLLNKTCTRSVFKNVENSKLNSQLPISDNSFIYDTDGTGLKSTQELPIDYTRFENHTFFNSARGKVDLAFDLMINKYPFDGSKASVQEFINNLTGFEKYVFDNFPKNVGYLNMSGAFQAGAAEGNYITVNDARSYNFPTLDKVNYGIQVLDTKTSPFTIETYLNLPTQVNDNQVVAQRNSTTAGMTLALSQSSSTSECKVLFLISSASESYLVASGTVNKGEWLHIAAELVESNGAKKAVIFLNQSASFFSSDTQDFDSLAYSGESLLIGSGTRHAILDYDFLPRETYSGSIDEFRFFKTERSDAELKSYARREIYADNSNLLTYFKFNEPTGSYAYNNVVLDSSGNKLHSYIANFKTVLRNTGSLEGPMTFENINYSPVLFTSNQEVSNYNAQLLDDAASYDIDNPNFIMKLVPYHYLTQGAAQEGLERVDQNLGQTYTASSVPGTGILLRPQMMLTLLLSYAKFYDELKLIIDYFSKLNYVDVSDEESSINKFLPFIADYYGIKLPNFFDNTTPDQFFYGETLSDDYAISRKSLKDVRYQMWRRILSNMTEIFESKGTRSSIRSAILSTGIIPDNFFNIREFGGPAVIDLKGLRQQTQEVSTLLDFSGSMAATNSSVNYQGFSADSPYMVSANLSGSRVEPGAPTPAGSFVSGISDDPSDGLLTSGSFTIESTVKFVPIKNRNLTQSVFRLETTGSSTPASTSACLLNVVFDGANEKLHLYARPSKESAAPTLDLTIDNVNLFNGEKWYIAAGRERGDLINSLSSSYFLKCGFVEDKTSYVFFTTSSYFSETTTGNVSNDMFQNLDASYNASGSFVVVGSQSLNTASGRFLNSASQYVTSRFDGRIGHIRFWSKGTSDTEAIEHLRNYRSLGVINPNINFSFDTETTGTFERLRVDASTDQLVTASNGSGAIEIFDFSQNSYHFAGKAFEINKKVIKNENFEINRISPNIDLMQTDEKVRVRSLLDPSSTDSYTSVAPLYELGPETAVNDDNRFSIEFSAYKALNEDIIGLIGDTQFLDDALGQTTVMFDDFYPDLEKLSKVYFERLTAPVDVRKFLELFKWFDASLTILVEQLLPRKTRFLGVNYVIESHVLERNRYRYPIDRMYLLSERPKDDSNIYLTALTGVIKKF